MVLEQSFSDHHIRYKELWSKLFDASNSTRVCWLIVLRVKNIIYYIYRLCEASLCVLCFLSKQNHCVCFCVCGSIWYSFYLFFAKIFILFVSIISKCDWKFGVECCYIFIIFVTDFFAQNRTKNTQSIWLKRPLLQ